MGSADYTSANPRTRATDQLGLLQKPSDLPTWYVWLAIRGTQLSSPTCGSTDRPMRETSIERPTPRKTRDAVVVPADLWPAYSCRELGGAGWAATIRRVRLTLTLTPHP